MAKPKHSFWYRNSLSLVLIVLALLPLVGQTYMGWKEYQEFLSEHNLARVSLVAYLGSGHFIEATFENWESEFFQMAFFVILTVFLRQHGSSESKDLDQQEEVDKEPVAKPDSPWPVRKGGVILHIYKHSLSRHYCTLSLFLWDALVWELERLQSQPMG